MTERLRPVFDGNIPAFVAESDELLGVLSDRGVEALDVDTVVAKRPADVVLFVERLETMQNRYDELRQALAQTRTLLVASCSFDAAPDTMAYTLELLLGSDFERAVARNIAWMDVLSHASTPLVFRNPATPDLELSCHLLGDLKVTARTTVALEPGDWASVIGYFEVEMEAFDSEAHYFSLDGRLPVGGLLTAKSSNIRPEREPLHAAMNAIIRRVGNQSGVVTAADNKLSSVVIGEEDLTEEVGRLTSDMYERMFVEFSIGTNSPAADVDWSLNSLLNEGLAGVHVAVGDGLDGAHVDFVSPGTRLVV